MPSARFDDLRAGTARAFPPPREILVARSHDDVPGVLRAVEGLGHSWAYGFVSYEAGAGLDASLPRVDPPDGTPLAWFAITDAPREVAPVVAPDPYPAIGPWRPDRDADAHRRGVRAVRERIAAGETYQANLTVPLRGPAPEDPAALYAAMAAEQRGAHHAYLDTGSLVIASASPELFVDVVGDRITMRPMKGTAARGPTTATDAAVRERLRTDPKERAENVMIVDLVRNDLGRVAVPGSIAVPALCTPERYGTVWQLTSEVTAQLAPGTDLAALFAATFPCGSVTGAPKRRSMEILAELEGGPRGVYCGAIGWVGHGLARFSVAIRTVVVDRTRGTAVYGVGGGITWGSDPATEHAEIRTKARVLERRTRPEGLLETFAAGRHVEAHLARLRDSAAYFDIPFDASGLRRAVAGLDGRVRVVLAADGTVEATASPLPPPTDDPVRLAVDTRRFDPRDPWRHHKTVHREPYDAARARHPDADDVVLVTADGELAETTIASLAVRLDGVWCTPPLSAGVLPGVERAHRIAAGELVERTLRPADLARAEGLAVLSSLRGWRPAVLGVPVPAPGPLVTMCDGCCCGTRRKHPGVDHEGLRARLADGIADRGRLRVTGCIDACERSNVVVVAPSPAGRRAGGRPVWLGGVVVPAAVDGITAWVRAGGPGLAAPPPDVALLAFPGPAQSRRTG